MTTAKRILIALCALGVLACGAGGFLFFKYVDFYGASRELPAIEKQAIAVGIPFTVAELGVVQVPPSQNAADLYRDLQDDPDIRLVVKTYSDGSSGRASLDTLDQVIRSKQGVIEKCRAAARMEGFDPGHDFDMGPAIDFRELGTAKAMAKVLCAAARWEFAKGEVAKAVGELKLAQRIGQQVGSEPGIIPTLVQIAIRAIVLSEVEYGLYTIGADRAKLEVVKPLMADYQAIDPKKVFRGEAYMTIAALRNFKSLGGLRGVTSVAGGGSSPTIDPRHLRRSGMPSGMLERAFMAKFLEYEVQAWRILDQHPDDLLAAGAEMKALDNKLDAEPGLSSGLIKILAPGYREVFVAFVKSQTQWTCTNLLVDVLLWKSGHGRWPTSLGEAGLAGTDPFAKAPLRYLLTKNGCRVYSVGVDRKDDGGFTALELRKKNPGKPVETSDLVAAYPPSRPLPKAP